MCVCVHVCGDMEAGDWGGSVEVILEGGEVEGNSVKGFILGVGEPSVKEWKVYEW